MSPRLCQCLPKADKSLVTTNRRRDTGESEARWNTGQSPYAVRRKRLPTTKLDVRAKVATDTVCVSFLA